MNYRKIAEQIFLAGVESVLPENLIPGKMSLKDNDLRIGGLNFSVSKGKIYVIGAGKASAKMGAAVEKILGDRISGGHIVVKYGYACKLKYIDITEAGHPLPDLNGLNATKEILKIAEKAGPDDLLICLISGGGSSLLFDLPEGFSLEEMITINNMLVNSGANIGAINAVRKHLSGIKGGQLAKLVYPATLVSLILSDVTDDSLDVIASGPTVPDSTTYLQAMNVLTDYGLLEIVPGKMLKYLSEGVEGIRPETPKPFDPYLDNTFNLLIGSNKIALEAARAKARSMNMGSLIIDYQLQGDITFVAEYIVNTSLAFKNDREEIKPLCLLCGGEPEVTMSGNGKGGRNQHLALLVSVLLKDIQGITVLSAGTDGTDGPTDAAGAVVDSETYEIAMSRHMDPEKFILDFDSYHFFEKAGGHIKTGPTMTNVMDMIVILIW